MTYDMFLQGPEVYLPIIFVSLIITVIAYGAIPVAIAKLRKVSITKRKYKTICYLFNAIVMVMFILGNGEASSGVGLCYDRL